jgi:hypothetical protein
VLFTCLAGVRCACRRGQARTLAAKIDIFLLQSHLQGFFHQQNVLITVRKRAPHPPYFLDKEFYIKFKLFYEKLAYSAMASPRPQ